MKTNIKTVQKHYGTYNQQWYTWDTVCDSCKITVSHSGSLFSTIRPVEKTVDYCKSCLSKITNTTV